MKGLRTVAYPTPDLDQGKAWYSRVFQTEPYFEEPFYIGFSIGGFELGLVPDAQPGEAGSQAFWGVDNIETELARVLALGAQLREAVTDVGGGIKIASVFDPFGNVIGLIENPHFDPSQVR